MGDIIKMNLEGVDWIRLEQGKHRGLAFVKLNVEK
jgi:hypothetical protein